jgi:amino acid adenylation domain-containing protein
VTALTAAPTLWAAFEIQAARTPDAVAAEDSANVLTYAELADRAARVAAVVSRIAAPRTFIGISLPRGVDVVVAILAVHAAGCAYVPMDPAYPHSRLRYMAADSDITLLLSDSENPPDWLPHGVQSLNVRTAGPADTAIHSRPSPSPTDPAYAIYTSGSTGEPKGVVVTHANVLALTAASIEVTGVRATDTWTMLHSYCFDFAVWEQWGALLTGGRLVIPEPDVVQSLDDLVAFLHDRRVSVLNIVPTVFRHLVSAYRRAVRPLSVRVVIFGGERLHAKSVNDFLSFVPEPAPRIINMYGITETTVFVTGKEIKRSDLTDTPTTPIGVPLPHLAVELLDENLTRVRDGRPGEIYIRGTGVTVGYLGRPELTARRYLTISLPGTGRARYYRSGDYAVRDERGELWYIGRSDDQIKIRGFRVEPGEIEACLRTHPTVLEAVVLMGPGPVGEEILIAYVVVADAVEQGRALTGALRRHVAEMCPEHMVPNRYVVVDSLPSTPSGKVDRSALRQA